MSSNQVSAEDAARNAAMKDALAASVKIEAEQSHLLAAKTVAKEKEAGHDCSQINKLVQADGGSAAHHQHNHPLPTTHTERVHENPGGSSFNVVDSEPRATEAARPAPIEKVSAVVANVEANKGGMSFDVLSPSFVEKAVPSAADTEAERLRTEAKRQLDNMLISSPEAARGGIAFNVVDASETSHGENPNVVLGPGAVPSVSSGAVLSGSLPMANIDANKGGLAFSVLDASNPVNADPAALYAARK